MKKLCLIMLSIFLLTVSQSFAADVSFYDDFESYGVGTNPSNVYNYSSFNAWNPPGPVLPDLYSVGTIGSNKVLQFNSDGNNWHFPEVMKLYNQEFTSLSEAGATFYRTGPSMGWNHVVFEYQDNNNYYMAGYSWNNKLYISTITGGVLGEVDLWGDINGMDMSNRVDIKRIDDKLIATYTRLDTMQTKSVEVTSTQYTGGLAGFGSSEDVFGGVHINVDNFSVKGTPIVPEPISAILFVTGGTLLAGRRYLRRKA